MNMNTKFKKEIWKVIQVHDTEEEMEQTRG